MTGTAGSGHLVACRLNAWRALQAVANNLSCCSSFSRLLLIAGGRCYICLPPVLYHRMVATFPCRTPCPLLHAYVNAVTQASKLMPPSSSMTVRTLQQDHYYAPLLVLTIPVTIAAVRTCPNDHMFTCAETRTFSPLRIHFWLCTLQRMVRWASMKLFQNS